MTGATLNGLRCLEQGWVGQTGGVEEWVAGYPLEIGAVSQVRFPDDGGALDPGGQIVNQINHGASQGWAPHWVVNSVERVRMTETMMFLSTNRMASRPTRFTKSPGESEKSEPWTTA